MPASPVAKKAAGSPKAKAAKTVKGKKAAPSPVAKRATRSRR
jgi:hypothetical protein